MLSAGAFTCLGGAIFFLAGHPTHRWFERRLRLRPAHSLRDEAARIWGLLCDNKMLVAMVIGGALITQLVHCVSSTLPESRWGEPLLPWLTFVPIVLAANALPITIAGIGIREYLLVLFLGIIIHVDGAHAVATSFVILSLILVICLLGGLLYIFYRPKSKLESSVETGAPAERAPFLISRPSPSRFDRRRSARTEWNRSNRVRRR